jgi:hypothetical protein
VYLRNANSEVKVYEADGKSNYAVALPTLGTVTVTGRWTSPQIRYEFKSFRLCANDLRIRRIDKTIDGVGKEQCAHQGR